MKDIKEAPLDKEILFYLNISCDDISIQYE